MNFIFRLYPKGLMLILSVFKKTLTAEAIAQGMVVEILF